MKKNYIQPASTLIQLHTEGMLAGSDTTSFKIDDYTVVGNGVKDQRSMHSIWQYYSNED